MGKPLFPFSSPSKKQHTLNPNGGARVAQSVKTPTLGFGSGLDLVVRGFEPRVGLHTGDAEPAWDSLSLSLSLLPLTAPSLLSLSLSFEK